MEILTSIWSALSTENENLINILSIPLTFVEIYIIFKIFTSSLNIIYTKQQSIIFICISSIVSIFSYYILPNPFYSLFDYLIMFILIKTIFKLSNVKSIICIILSFGIYSISGTIILNLLVKIINITFEQINSIPLYRYSFLTCMYIVLFFLIKLLDFKKIHITVLDTVSYTNKKIIIINLIFGLITLCIQLFITFYYATSYSFIFAILNFICFITYLFVSIISLNRTMNLQLKTEQLEIAENYNKSLQTLYDSVKAFKHDLNNMIHIIGGYVDTNDIDGLRTYYNGLKKDYVRINNIEILNPTTINNPGIYSLIVAKQNKASELKVNISLEVFFDFDNIKMPIYDFSRILGILLDNAIEASSECEEKHIRLMFRESRKNHTQIICIENTYNNKDVDIKTIFEKGVSGKSNHTGIGLWEVNEIISNNNNIVLHTSKEDRYFKQQLEIYY